MNNSTSYERKKAVSCAWKKERELVLAGRGTRDWSKQEQKEIIKLGRAHGYEGHHMKSVSNHASHAGKENNIQFLTRKEHLAAHDGCFRNKTNGRYDPATGKTNDFGRYGANIDSQKLTNRLNEEELKNASRSAERQAKIEAARKKAQAAERRQVQKTSMPTETDSKTLSAQRAEKTAPAERSGASESKTLSAQRAERAVSAGKSEASQSKTLSAQRKNGAKDAERSGKTQTQKHKH